MSNYNYNNIVNRGEAEALKEMIFNRAREKAQALDENIKSSYMDSVQNDIMKIAYDSFNDVKNPFFDMVKNSEVKASPEAKPAAEERPAAEEKKLPEDIRYTMEHVEALKSKLKAESKTYSKAAVSAQVESNMDDARREFSNRSTFIGALNFLNSQASISLIQKSGKKFEAVA